MFILGALRVALLVVLSGSAYRMKRVSSSVPGFMVELQVPTSPSAGKWGWPHWGSWGVGVTDVSGSNSIFVAGVRVSSPVVTVRSATFVAMLARRFSSVVDSMRQRLELVPRYVLGSLRCASILPRFLFELIRKTLWDGWRQYR